MRERRISLESGAAAVFTPRQCAEAKAASMPRVWPGLMIATLAAGCFGSSTNPGTTDGGVPGSGSGSTSESGATSTGDDASTTAGDAGSSVEGDGGGVLSPFGADGGLGDLTGDGAAGRINPPAGTDGGAGQIVCGALVCDSTTQVCCVGSNTCIAPGETCSGTTLACTGTNGCTAGVCCATAAAAGRVTSACKASCAADELQLCTTNADCASADVCRAVGDDYGECVRAPITPTRDGGAVTPVPLEAGL